MPRAFCLLAALIVMRSSDAMPRAAAQDAIAIGPLYAAHLAGNYNQLAQVFASEGDFRRARGEIFTTAREWRATWKPSQAAFLFDLALVGFARGWEDAPALLGGARDLAVTRKDAPGASAADDAFEVTMHRAALALLVSRQSLDLAEAYLAPLATRLSDGSTISAEPRLVDPRSALLRGMLLEIRTAPAHRPNGREPDAFPSLRIDPADDASKRRAEQAIAFYTRVGAHPDTFAESAVRRGFLLHRLGRHDEALAVLAQANGTTDATLQYWAHLFRARTLEATGKPADAGLAYEAAAGLFPHAQTPAVALASLWRRHDRPAEAERWAAAARSATGADPWWDYWLGDRRLLPVWVPVLRRGRP